MNMLRAFVLVPWLFIWPWFFGLALSSFTPGAMGIWLVTALLCSGICVARVSFYACILGYVFGMVMLPSGWQHLSFDMFLWRIPNATPRMETRSVGWAANIRSWGTGRLYQALPEREAILAAGMLYGDAAFASEDKKRIRAAGISHIVAVSGANILFLLSLVRALVHRAVQRKQWRLAVDFVCILGIVVLTGASASVLRAGLVLVLLSAASSFGRRASFSRLLLISAFFLVLFEPRRLVFDAGFLLSYLACTGLLHSKDVGETEELFEKLELKSTRYTWLWTTPFQLWFFGGITWIGLIANALVLFVVPWIQTLAIIALVLPMKTPMNWLLEQCLKHIWFIVDFISRYSSTASLAPRSAFLVMVALYLFLIVALIHKRTQLWTKQASAAVDISRKNRAFQTVKSLGNVPFLFDSAPELVIHAVFSMLRLSATKDVRAS